MSKSILTLGILLVSPVLTSCGGGVGTHGMLQSISISPIIANFYGTVRGNWHLQRRHQGDSAAG
jgi:hypothetical protein